MEDRETNNNKLNKSYSPYYIRLFVASAYLRELVTCYFFPEGVDTSGEH